MAAADLARLHLVVSGRVQGVFFRRATAGQARVLGIKGFARNRANGTVEVTAEGARENLALLLAWLGIYSVISYTVAQRTHEIGIRMALGAERRDVLAIVTGYGLRLALAGFAIGLTGSYFLSKLVASYLYSVKPADPAAFALGSVAVAGIVLLASYVPARRAMRVDPVVALRYE